MRFFKVCHCFVILLTMLALTGAVPAASKNLGLYEKSIVLLHVAKQSFDFESPWAKSPIRKEKYLGTVVKVGKGKDLAVLVTSYAVADSTEILMQKFSSTKQFEMQVAFVDYEVNLALLKPVQTEAGQGLSPLSLSKDLSVGSKVSLITDQQEFKLTTHPGELSAVGVYEVTTSSYQMLHYLLKVQKRSLGWSEPIIYRNKLVSITSGQGRDYIYGIPTFIIKHFLNDRHDDKYRGFPDLGLTTEALISPYMREALKAPASAKGVRIAHVEVNSPFYPQIQENDILLAINDRKLSEKGLVGHKKWDDIAYMAYINELYSGDNVTLKILQNGQKKTLQKVISRFHSNDKIIRHYRYGEKEPHLIFGGLVFQELTRNFLQIWGSDWEQTAQSNLLCLWHYQNFIPDLPNKRIIVLNKVLADEFNRGYENTDYQIVTEVNDRPIHSMDDLRKAFAKPLLKNGQRFTRIKLELGRGEIILGYDGLWEAHQRISEHYGIAEAESFYIEQ